MNFTPFGTTFSTNSLPASTNASVHQLASTGAKFSAHNMAAAATGQVLGVLSSDDGGVTYLRPVDTNGFTVNLAQQQPVASSQQHNQVLKKLLFLPKSFTSKSLERKQSISPVSKLVCYTGPTSKLIAPCARHPNTSLNCGLERVDQNFLLENFVTLTFNARASQVGSTCFSGTLCANLGANFEKLSTYFAYSASVISTGQLNINQQPSCAYIDSFDKKRSSSVRRTIAQRIISFFLFLFSRNCHLVDHICYWCSITFL